MTIYESSGVRLADMARFQTVRPKQKSVFHHVESAKEFDYLDRATD